MFSLNDKIEAHADKNCVDVLDGTLCDHLADKLFEELFVSIHSELCGTHHWNTFSLIMHKLEKLDAYYK